MAKKGTCENCRREKISLVSKGLCWKCYDAQRGLEGGKREIALANARTKPAKKYKERSTAKNTAGPDQGAAPTDSEKSPVFGKAKDAKTDNASVAGPLQEDPPTILLEFNGPDAELYKRVVALAVKNRRDVAQDILYMLQVKVSGVAI